MGTDGPSAFDINDVIHRNGTKSTVPCIASLKLALYLWIPEVYKCVQPFKFLPPQNS